jgi:D-alanyl-D-alanine carboxypeptidase
LRSYGCDSITLAPTSADLPRNSPVSANQVSIIAVPADVAGRLDLLATPTTIVTDRQWRVAWAKAGTLGRGDQEKALSSLEKLR